jgi:hypothetical protein
VPGKKALSVFIDRSESAVRKLSRTTNTIAPLIAVAIVSRVDSAIAAVTNFKINSISGFRIGRLFRHVGFYKVTQAFIFFRKQDFVLNARHHFLQ